MRPIRPLRPPPGYGSFKQPDPVNLNPLSSKGGLDALSFFATLALLSGALLFFGEFMQKLLVAPRLSGDGDTALKLFGVWMFGCSVGFWFVTSAFVKRWAWILGYREAPGFVRKVLRVSLLSPLLGIFFTVLTLAFTRRGPVRERAVPGMTYLLVAVALGLFHAGFLLYRVNSGELVREGVTLRLKDREVLAAESLRATFPGLKVPGPFIPEFLQIHIAPYLNPALKYSLAMYTDYRRADILAEHARVGTPALCRENESYLGVIVDNCFFSAYVRAGEKIPFASPVFGLLYETKYRQKIQPKSPEAAVLMLSNLVALIESLSTSEGRKGYLHPLGLLRYYGSPEIPMLEFGRDLQKAILVEKISPVVDDELKKLDDALKPAAAQAGGEAFLKLTRAVHELKTRLAAVRPMKSML